MKSPGIAIIAFVAGLSIGLSGASLVWSGMHESALQLVSDANDTAEKAIGVAETWKKIANDWKAIAEGKAAFDTDPFSHTEEDEPASSGVSIGSYTVSDPAPCQWGGDICDNQGICYDVPADPCMDPEIVEHNRRMVTHEPAPDLFIAEGDWDTTITTIEPSQFTWTWSGAETYVTLGMDGTIEYGPNYKPDEAAKMFWDHVAKGAPCAEKQP